MNQVILPYVVGFILQEFAAEDFQADEAKFDGWLETASPWLKAHPRITHMLEGVAHPVLKAVELAVRDAPDIKRTITALAGSNLPAAEAAVLALARTAAPGLMGAVLGAA